MKGHMEASLNWGTPIWTSNYSDPYNSIGTPKKGIPIFLETLIAKPFA